MTRSLRFSGWNPMNKPEEQVFEFSAVWIFCGSFSDLSLPSRTWETGSPASVNRDFFFGFYFIRRKLLKQDLRNA